MEIGVKEDPTLSKEPKFLGKAGWVKKAPGRMFASYKDRYIHVEKTEIVVYEKEDLQNCLERINLENYDKCHELKSHLKRKHRLILIRSVNSGNKVSDVRLQAQTAEEKEAWIKALTDGISRAKNKVFDEVKVDESSNLDHVTRTRAKGNRNRRPPTRIHMKEVAVVSCDGILRLDLDLENAMMPNEIYYANVDGTEMPEETIGIREPTDEVGTSTKPELGSQKVIKPPMPPNKDAKPSSVSDGEPDKNDGSEKKVLKPPMPPTKKATSCISPSDDITKEPKAEKSSEAGKMMDAPPIPPNKPSSRSTLGNLTEPTQFQSSMTSKSPTLTSTNKKPSYPAVQPDQEFGQVEDEYKTDDDDHRKEKPAIAIEIDEADPCICKIGQVSVESEDIPSTGDQNLEGPGENKISPLLPSNQMPEKCLQSGIHVDDSPTKRELHGRQKPKAPDNIESFLQTEESLTRCVPSVVASLNDPLTDSIILGPLLCPSPMERKMKPEEKSLDSGQHSGNDSEGSGGEDPLAASAAALRGSQPGLDVLDANEDNIPISLRLRQTKAVKYSSTKVKSASIGDLLSDSSVFIQGTPNIRDVAQCGMSPTVMKLENEVALEMEKTDKLLCSVSKLQDEGDRKSKDLLTEAMEKLKKADYVLREIRKLKLVNNPINRKSW